MQDYDAAFQNAVKSFNARMRAVVTGPVSSGVGTPVSWYSEGERPKEPVYPYVSATILRLGSYDRGRRKLRTRIQVDVFTTHHLQGLARRIAGRMLTELGIRLDNDIQACDVAQIDGESGQDIPQLEMELEVQYGWEPASDPDPAVTHLFTEFLLFHH
ncbi:MAG: hypothetical protein ACO1RX_20155 [Candidatus Sericytochromatia bacterium]